MPNSEKLFDQIKNRLPLKTVITAIAGAILGFAYYYFVGCKTGSCPITGNPVISTIYGGIIGLVLGFPTKRGTKTE